MQQEARRTAAESCYSGGREECLALAKQLACAAGVPQEAAYSALILMDYCLVAGMPFPRVTHLTHPAFELVQLFSLEKKS
jgi:hypothetical protein